MYLQNRAILLRLCSGTKNIVFSGCRVQVVESVTEMTRTDPTNVGIGFGSFVDMTCKHVPAVEGLGRDVRKTENQIMAYSVFNDCCVCFSSSGHPS